jgi:cytochrome c biogenesis protein CcdA
MLQILFAIVAGILTIASPCILPILPIILGTSIGKTGKSRPFFIVLGFIVAFTSAALILSTLTRSIGLNPSVIRTIGIIVLAVFGLLLLWPKLFDLLMKKFIPLASNVSLKAGLGDKGNWSAFFLGLTLGIVWTPCAGPVLASILTLIALEKNLIAAAILLIAYSLGAGVPMLAIAFGGQYMSEKVAFISKYSNLLQKIFGFIIIALAVTMYFNLDTKLYALILAHYPVFNSQF